MSTYSVYFSPTGSTEKVVKLIAGEFKSPEDIDLSSRKLNLNYNFTSKDLCIIGVPSFGGRVPEIALKRMEKFFGDSTNVILVVTYGNRAFDDTLLELKNYLEEKNFKCIGALAVVAQHSIMDEFAQGRPNLEDESEILNFTKKLIGKIGRNNQLESIELPGNFPYVDYKGLPLKPKTNSTCIECGVCEDTCPVAAIPEDNPRLTNEELCISCMRCVKVCPLNARSMDENLVKMSSDRLREVCSIPKKNQFFI